jgi:hypothetical protein
MKKLLLCMLIFVAFFSSCNLFTLTGAETSIPENFYSSGNSIPPIATGTSVSGGLTGGSNPSCGLGQTVIIFGAGFTSDISIELYNITEASFHTPTSISFIDSTEIQIVLPGNLGSAGSSFSIKVSNSYGVSKTFAFRIACA